MIKLEDSVNNVGSIILSISDIAIVRLSILLIFSKSDIDSSLEIS